MAGKKKTAKRKKPAQKASSVRASAVPLQPLSDRVVVRPLSPEELGTESAHGILIPEAAQEKASEGVVVAVGPGKYVDGGLVPMAVSVGDRVMFGKYGHEEVKVGGTEYFIVSESNILAIIKK
ncbi:MAG: co-chaperone GroES [Candidatus Paceibacteria bacterium]